MGQPQAIGDTVSVAFFRQSFALPSHGSLQGRVDRGCSVFALRAPANALERLVFLVGTRYHRQDIRAAFITHVAITSGGVAAQSLARHADYETTLADIHVADEVKPAAANRATIRPTLHSDEKSQTAKMANPEITQIVEREWRSVQSTSNSALLSKWCPENSSF